METKKCIICGKEQHLDECLELCGQALCRTCEDRIVNVAVHDHDYDELIIKLKKLWVNKALETSQ